MHPTCRSNCDILFSVVAREFLRDIEFIKQVEGKRLNVSLCQEIYHFSATSLLNLIIKKH